MFSRLAGIIFLLGLFAHVGLTARAVLTARSLKAPLSRATLAWNGFFGLALTVLTVWGMAGLVDGGPFAPLAPLVATPAIVAIAQVTLARERIFAHLASLEPRLRHRAEWGLLLAAALLGMTAIEFPWSWAFGLFGPSYWWLELALVGLAMLCFYLVGRRRGASIIPAAAFFAFIGVAQYFVRKFKNAAILPNDLLALGTAAAVSDQYTYSIDPRAVLGMVVICALACVLSLLHPSWSVQADDTSRGHAGADAGRGLAAAALCAALVLMPNYMKVFQVQIMYWYSINFYEKQGFLPTFIAVWQDMPIHKPKDYTTEDAEQATTELAKRYDDGIGASKDRQEATAQFDEKKPAILVVMNESFADLSIFDGLRSGYEGPQFFKSLPDALWRGKLFVDVHGGGTCNSEFEFLTGNSLGYIGAGKYPYSTFQLGEIDSLPKQLAQLGYRSIAIHPNYASNWNRNKVYPALGFDDFLDIDDFGGFPERGLDGRKKSTTPTGVPVFHSGVTDQATYERMLDMLAEGDEPQLIFNVTMQNHGSYNQNNIPEDLLTHYYPTGTYDNPAFAETPERLNEYLSCIEESDRALEWFVGKLRKLDRPVVLVFFGDHQPSMTPDYNDAWYQNEDDLTHTQRIYHANYLVWANYDVAGQDQKSEARDLSVDNFAAQVLSAVGAPLTDYQKAQLATGEDILATNLHGYLGADGVWYAAEDEEGPYRAAYDKMALVEYLNFAERL